MRTVLKEPTAGDMEDALASLSRDLSEAFEETITRIQRLPENRRRLGMRTLLWISHAKRPLAAPELSDILSVQLGQTVMRPKYRPAPKVVIECCQGLVKMESDTMKMSLAHHAIQEYLVENSGKFFSDPEVDLAASCLTYLLLDVFKQGPCPDEDRITRLIEYSPFITYASTYWGVHAQGYETNSVIEKLTFEFLNRHPATACATQVGQFTAGLWEIYWDPEECYSLSALHVASHFGLNKIVHVLLNSGSFPVNAVSKINRQGSSQRPSLGCEDLITARR